MPRDVNPNIFAGNPLDRMAEKRKDEAWLAATLKDPSTLILPLWRDKPFVLPGRDEGSADVGWLRPGILGDLVPDDAATIFLGVEKDTAYFAVDVTAAPDPEDKGPLANLGSFEDLRSVTPRLHPLDAAIVAQAKSMIDWHKRHGYCANCGTPTVVEEAGYKRHCYNCHTDHFPRTDPVAIVLPVHGDTCLLGRGPQFPAKFFSCLAGFVEPGETVAEAARREVHEESGVRIGACRYLFDQPWPYPSSLMIGLIAEAETTRITLDEEEIEDARWFDRAEIRDALKGSGDGSFYVPPEMTIAHQILKAWVFEGMDP